MRIIQYLKRLFIGDHLKDPVATLLSGTAIALLISYLAQPILTRLYSPEAFGLFDTFVSLLGLLIPFASLRYEDAIMLPEDEREARDIMRLSLLLVLIVSLLSILFWFLGPWVDRLFGSETLSNWLILLPLAIPVLRISKLGELWLTRQKTFNTVASGQIAQSGITATLRIALGGLSSAGSPLGLLSGYIAGLTTVSTWYAVHILRASTSWFTDANKLGGLKAAASRYRRFPIFSMPSTLLSALLARLPVILLFFYFDESTVGYFGRAFALFAVPLSLVGNAISQVFFVEGAEANRKGALPVLTRNVHARLIMLGLFPTLAMMLAGPDVFGFIFGDTWRTAGVYLQLLAPWFFLASVASPLTRVFDLLEAQRMDLSVSTFMFILQTTLLVVGGLTGDIHTCLLILCIGGCLARCVHLGVILKLAGVPYRHALADLFKQASYALLPLAILYGTMQLQRPWLTTVTLLLFSAGYGISFLRDRMS